MFDALKRMHFCTSVMAEIKSQSKDQALVNLICTTSEAKEWMEFDRLRMKGVKTRIAAFVSSFSVLAYSLTRDDITLEDKKRIATLLNDRNARAQSDFQFYSLNADLFLAAQSTMHEFCLRHDLDPDELCSESRNFP